MQHQNLNEVTINNIELRQYETHFRILRRILPNILNQILYRLLTVVALNVSLNLLPILLDVPDAAQALHGE